MTASTDIKMRKLILSGTYAQYRDWLVQYKASPRAAVYIHESDQLRFFDPVEDMIVLADGHMDNPAFGTTEYLQFIHEANKMALAS